MALNTSNPIELMNSYFWSGNNSAAATGPYVIFQKSHGPFQIAGSATQQNDVLGYLSFAGDDESASIPAAQISATCMDNTVAASGVVTSQLGFSTFNTSLAERMTIGKDGAVTINAPDGAAVGLTIAGGGLSVTGAITYTTTTYTVTASAASATAISFDATNAAGGITMAAGTGGLNLGNQADCTTIGIGDFAPTASRTTTIGGGTVITAAVTDTVDIGPDGATTNANSVKTVNINTGGVTLGQVLTNIASGTVTSGTHTTGIASGNRAAGTMALNVMTGTGTKTTNIGNADGLTTVNIDAITLINDSINVQTSINTGTSTGAVVIGNALAGAMSIDTAAGISLDGATASNFTVTGAGADLTLASVGGSVLVSSTENAAQAIRLYANGGILETIELHVDQGTDVASINLLSDLGGIALTATGNATADAINLNAVAGGVDIDAALAVDIDSSAAGIEIDGVLASNFTVTGAGQDLTLSSVGGSVLVESTENAAQAIRLHANGGVLETIELHADQGTDPASINLLSDLGGITLTATGNATADAINLSAVAGGVDIDGQTGVTIDSAAGAVSIDAANASNLTVSAAGQDLTLESTLGTVIVNSGEDTAQAIYLHANGGVTETIQIHADQGTAATSVYLLSDAGGITATATAGAIDVNASTGITIDSATAGVSVDGVTASNFTVTGAAADLTLSSVGGSVIVAASEAAADAVQITASDAGGGIAFSAGAGACLGTLDADGLRVQSNYRVNAVRTGGSQAVGAANIVIFNTEGFDPGNDYNDATGVYTAPASGIYRITAVVSCLDGVGGGTKTLTLRDGGAGTNYVATATVANAERGILTLSVLYELTAADTIDIYYAGGAGDTVLNGAHLMVEFAYIN